jgi:hypothetical protein
MVWLFPEPRCIGERNITPVLVTDTMAEPLSYLVAAVHQSAQTDRRIEFWHGFYLKDPPHTLFPHRVKHAQLAKAIQQWI